MSNIVGFQSGHDVSYCLLSKGKPKIHEELERFSRVKEQLGDGLKMYFDMNNTNENQVDFFSFGNFSGRSGRWAPRTADLEAETTMKRILNKNNGKFYELSHHMSHAANAFFSSNYKDALIVTIDGGGNESDGSVTCATIYKGSKNKIEKVKNFDFFDLNIGVGWNFITTLFGLSISYPKGNQAGTVMAMASMSDSKKYVNQLVDVMTKKQASIEASSDPQQYGEKIFGKKVFSEDDKFEIASSLQEATEIVFKEAVKDNISKFKVKNLCIAGGCALNSVLIGKIQSWFPDVENIYVPPVPYDSGLAIGSAQYLWHQILDNKRIQWIDNFTPYLGRQYSMTEIMDSLDTFEGFLKVKIVDELEVLELLNNQRIVSVFGGGSESGRRALGNRSILADPRSNEMKDLINKEVKHRQWFRPFAPSIIKESVKDWFEQDVSSPYMTHVVKWKENKRKNVPAVVHFDNTARLQTVTKNDNNWYYHFLKKWEKISKVPVLLNTSFNDTEPIVETPLHALNCFLKTKINYLYFYDFNILVSK